MSNSSSIPVLIVGAGPGGLSAALTLAKNGIKVRIVDKIDTFSWGTRGSGIQPRTLEVFKFFGILDDFYARGFPLVPMRVYKLPGGVETAKQWNLHANTVPTPKRPYMDHISMRQCDLEGIFREHLARLGVEVELRTELVGMEQDADGVTAKLRKHSSDGASEELTVRADYLIGTDGAKGPTRKLINTTFEGVTKEGDSQVWADVHLEGLDPDVWHTWAEPGKFMVAARWVGKHNNAPNLYYVGIIAHEENATRLADPVKFVEVFHELTGRKDIKFTKFDWISAYRPNVRMVDKFQEGRVFVGGEAAHVHSPAGGQGINNSVQDSLNLGWKLSLVLKGLAPASLVSTYQDERLPVIKQMLIVTDALYTRVVGKQQEGTKLSTAAEGAGLQNWNSNEALFLFGVNYRWSRIVQDLRGTDGATVEQLQTQAYQGYPQGVRAGDRAPEGANLVDESGKETSLFQLFDLTRHTVIIFSPGSAEARSEVEAITAVVAGAPEGFIQTIVIARDGVPDAPTNALAFHDKNGYAQEAYEVDGAKVVAVIVRPDGFIGAFADSADSTREYFTKLAPGLLGSA